MSDIDQLRAFVAAADCGSFSAAARNLGKAQSVISTTISNLEIDLNLPLFDREGYRPVLTEQGISVLRHARTVLESVDALRGQAEALNGAMEPSFSLYVEDGLLVERVRSLIGELSETFPVIELSIEQRPRDMILNAFESGEANGAFVTQAPEGERHYQSRGIGFQRIVPVCRADHPLAAKKRVSRSDLACYRQIVEGLPSSSKRHFSPDVWVSVNPDIRKQLVSDGLGWAELPVTTVERDVLDGELKVIDYAFAQNAILKTVDFLTSNPSVDGPVMRWAIEQISSWDQRAWIGDHQVGRR
ncbi:LysR family transcriptional regulator [Roseibium sp. RKSG952]|uniref:LysR family transcriptional regulator n=1 Tax=Roseibium sp. RKSG952 TaxID=2529384 RepID=UPI0018AD103F|nr:LysR family transcriptional regulator [Roseibium sp. RKSG952]